MKIRIPYLVEKPNGDGTSRFYWQPSKALRLAGWETETLPPDAGLAMDKARRLNAELKDWYEAGKPRRRHASIGSEAGEDARRGSVRELIRLYRKPPDGVMPDPEADAEARADGVVFGYDYATLKDATKRSYDAYLDYIDKWMGPVPARKVDESMILERLKTIANQRHDSGPHKGKRKIATALGIGRVGRMLFHSSRTLVPPSHPCYIAKKANPWSSLRARERREIPVLWTKEGRDLVIAAAEKLGLRSIAVAIKIEWWIGQREGDILKLGHNFNPADVLQLMQSKTAAHVHLPVGMVPEIAEAVDQLRQAQRAAGLSGIRLLLDERNGLVWDEHRFRKAFQMVRICAVEDARWQIRHKAPGWEGRDEAWITRTLELLTFMRLRHTVVTMLYRAGATIPEIAAITGHTIASVNGIIERYGLRDAETAGNALAKRLEKEGI